VIQVSAATAREGDIRLWTNALGAVESSNSVGFAIPEDCCQQVMRKFEAHQVLAVEAYDRSMSKKVGDGFLAGVDNQIDTNTGTLRCRGRLVPEGNYLMLPGRFLNIRMLLETKHGVTVVPAVAVQRDAEPAFVWVIQADGTVTPRQVSVGAQEGEWTEIRSGLSPGELVVSGGGVEQLRQGQKVRYELRPEAESGGR
jgi:multidrug efflux system membrane fusion protein